MGTPRFSSVADYLASLNPAKAKTLSSVVDFALREFPALEAKIAWNVPQVHRCGQYVLGVSSAKHHLSIAPWSPMVIDDFRARLEHDHYVVRKNLFQIPDDWTLDAALLRDLVQARLAEFG